MIKIKNLRSILTGFFLLTEIALAEQIKIKEGDTYWRIAKELKERRPRVYTDSISEIAKNLERINNIPSKKLKPGMIIKTDDNLESIIEKEIPINEKKEDFEEYFKYIAFNEGIRNFVYDDAVGKRLYPGEKAIGNRTIGVGHNLERQDSKKVFERVLPEINYYDVLYGKRVLKDEEVKKLFLEDVKIYLERTRKIFPKFDTYPLYLRRSIIDGVYRGDLSGSPKTIKLINEGKFEEASQEYLNNQEYRNAKIKGKSGIKKRMERNSEAMRRYGQELKQNIR
ncbi:MAG: LysM peptidoglycan-binding domain-containing protein [Candidatus Pacearchaeota archaeon]